MNIKKILERKYILASRSDRRKKLLKQLGLHYTAIDSKVEEVNSGNLSPLKLIRINSEKKSRKIADGFRDEIVIGSDTIVVLGREILGKPRNEKEAVNFLTQLSGRKHTVYTGINLIDTKTSRELFSYEKTTVQFRNLKSEEIIYYVKKYKPLDKAGAYGIQDDFGCLFIKKIIGDYYNVVGLPLTNLFISLQKLLSK